MKEREMKERERDERERDEREMKEIYIYIWANIRRKNISSCPTRSISQLQ